MMIKKILKSAVTLLSLGLIASPAYAADWGVSGQVRVDWDILKSIEDKVDVTNSKNGFKNDVPGKKRTPQGVFVQGGDSWVSFDLKGENTSGSLQYYADGRRAFVANGSGESGNWTANASITVRDDEVQRSTKSPRDGDVVNSTKSGDQTVEVSNGAFSLKLGFTTPLDTYRQGRSYLLMGDDGDVNHLGGDIAEGADLGAMDNRTSVAQIGYKVGDAISVGVAFQDNDSGSAPLGSAFGSINYDNRQVGGVSLISPTGTTIRTESKSQSAADVADPNKPAVRESVSASANDTSEKKTTATATTGPLGNMGIKVNYNTDFLKAGLVFVTAGESGVEDSNGNKDYTATASAFGLGVGLSLGALKPYFNLWMPNTTAENKAADALSRVEVKSSYADAGGTRTTTTVATTQNYAIKSETGSSAMQLGVDFALSDDSGVGFSYVNRTSTRKETATLRSTSTARTQTASPVPPAAGAPGGPPVYDPPSSAPPAPTPPDAIDTGIGEQKNQATTIELGYSSKLGASNFYLGFVNTSYKVGDEDAVGVTWIKARLQQSF